MEQMRDVYRVAEERGILDQFLLVPVSLFRDSRYVGVSNPSKLLYVLMLARLYADPHEDGAGNTYILYPLREVCENLNCTTPTAVQYIEELEHWGLIKRGKKRNGFASRFYLMLF